MLSFVLIYTCTRIILNEIISGEGIIDIYTFGILALTFLFISIPKTPLHKSNIVIDGSLDNVFNKSLQVAPYLCPSKIDIDFDKKIIEFRTKMTLSSYGENIILSFEKVNENQVNIDIQSQLRFGLVDFGVNSKRVTMIENILSRIP